MESPEHEARDIRQYVELQSGEKVVQLEKIASERILGRKHDIWDVYTETTRWWVITDLMNLYSHEDFRSMDQVLSFHIGAMARIIERQRKDAPEEERYHLPGAWRRFSQAVDAYNAADEAEEFQAVGIRCRQSLLAFVRDIGSESWLPSAAERPQMDNFRAWAELVAEAVSTDRLRAYLKEIAKSTWNLVVWLQHESNATRFDGEMALDATENVLGAFGMAIVKHQQGMPDRCPKCGSYKVVSDYRPELNVEPPYVTLCGACGWEKSAGEK